MVGRIPIGKGWQISGECIAAPEEKDGFRLPGADDLTDFSDLLGEPEVPQEEMPSRAFSFPAALEKDLPGPVSVSGIIPFSSIKADRVLLTLPLLYGKGAILLGKQAVGTFDGVTSMVIDLTRGCAAARSLPLTINFDETRPAGIDGIPMLSFAVLACFEKLSCEKETIAWQVRAFTGGQYRIRFCFVCGEKRETSAVSFAVPDANGIHSGNLPCPFPIPGGQNVTIRAELEKISGHAVLCDEQSVLFGISGEPPRVFLPLTEEESQMPPSAILSSSRIDGITALGMKRCSWTAAVYFLQRGIRVLTPQVLPLANVFPDVPLPAAESAVQSAWQMCGLLLRERRLPEGASEKALLREIAGRNIDPDSPELPQTLAWLRAVRLRMLAEAARQGKKAGALCQPGETADPDVREALACAFRPDHLSAIPLCGAWWSGSRFSAQLKLFSTEPGAVGEAVLETEDGTRLASCRITGEALLSCQLPDVPCVLQLTLRVLREEKETEISEMPVYTGVRGPLEAALRQC